MFCATNISVQNKMSQNQQINNKKKYPKKFKKTEMSQNQQIKK